MLPPFHMESSHVQPILDIQTVHIAVIKFSPGVASLSILEIIDLVTFHQRLHLDQLTPRLTAVYNQPMPLLTCFYTNVAERCPILVLAVQLPPTRLTRAFYSGWSCIKSARPNGVLNSVLIIADWRYELS